MYFALGVHLTAYSPLGSQEPTGTEVLTNYVVNAVATESGICCVTCLLCCTCYAVVVDVDVVCVISCR